MYRFSGLEGRLYFVSDPAPFRVFLGDCGDGFDWRATGLLYEGDPEVEVLEDSWQVAAPEQVHASGRLSLKRCARGKQVRATGVCRHLTLAASGPWTLMRDVIVGPETLSGGRQVQTGETLAVLSEPVVEAGFRPQIASEALLARLVTPGGCFQGMGSVSDNGGSLHVIFEEGVTHDPL